LLQHVDLLLAFEAPWATALIVAHDDLRQAEVTRLRDLLAQLVREDAIDVVI
jgi:hypothetical protein